ncbi:MAG: tRNA pseudouridine(55) synthase [Lachnospiraceae bacterium]|nr:tRNA pseudouridine(55) synthase [Lachnospiraceae bacterium]
MLLLGLTTDTQDLTGTVTGRAGDFAEYQNRLQNPGKGDCRRIENNKRNETEKEERIDLETDKLIVTEEENQLVSETKRHSDIVRILGNLTEVTEESIRDIIMSFVGKSEQIPPMYSALKVNGKKLYELAREGKEVERKPREIEIYKIDIKEIDLPRVRFAVECSKGTYIRTLCADIGEKAGCGGAMESLLRTRVDRFVLSDAKKLSEIEEYAAASSIDEILMQADQMFLSYPAYCVKETALKAVQNGNALPPDGIERIEQNDLPEDRRVFDDVETKQNPTQDNAGLIRVYDESGRFYGLYEVNSKAELCKPYKMFL